MRSDCLKATDYSEHFRLPPKDEHDSKKRHDEQ